MYRRSLETMKRAMTRYLYLIVGIYILYFIGLCFTEPVFTVRIITLFIWLFIEYCLISKFLFLWRKNKIQENAGTGNQMKYHSIKYIFNEKIDFQIRKRFNASELLQAEITENRFNENRLQINKILFGEMLIEDINCAMRLFCILRKSYEVIVISKRNDKHQRHEKSVNNLREILYLIFDYPHKHYTFKYFEV